MKRVLLARTDKLGDLLLSLVAVRNFKAGLPEDEVVLLCQAGLAPVVTGYLASIGVGVLTDETAAFAAKADAFGALFCERGLAARAVWRRVPIRVGAYSKAWSFLAFNSGLRQHRGRAEKHESEYTRDLAALLFSKLTGQTMSRSAAPITLPVDPVAEAQAKQILRGLGLEPGGFAVLHPGMAGSALNPSAECYAGIYGKLRSLSFPWLVSEGPLAADRTIVAALEARFSEMKVLRGQTLAVLKEVFRLARLVVAPSTGPLHLAHFVGTSTFGIYSPIRNHHPRRWAPAGGSGKVAIGLPDDAAGMETHDWAGLILRAAGG